jgi:hypothetical protein
MLTTFSVKRFYHKVHPKPSTTKLSWMIKQLFLAPKTGIQLNEKDWETIIFILRHIGMLANLFYIAKNNGILKKYSPYAQKHLTSARMYSDRQALQVHHESKKIKLTLGKFAIDPIYLKGASYTLRQSNNSLGRIYSDIDVLVQKDEIEDAQTALNQSGWHSNKITDYDKKYYREWAHEIPPMAHIERGTTIDLHHNLIPPISGRAPNINLFTKDVEKTSDGYLVLYPPATFLHSLVHLCNNEEFGNGFRDLVDLFLLAKEFGDDRFWEQLEQLALETSFTLELYYTLTLLKLFFDGDIPQNTYSRLENKHKSLRSNVVIRLLRSALKPHHPLTLSKIDNLHIFILYIRGHWIKMPFHILVKHLSTKAFFNIRDKLFGKHQFEKEINIRHN